MAEWDQPAVQDRVFGAQEPRGMARLGALEDSRASVNWRPGWPAADRRRCELDERVALNALELARRVPGAEVRVRALDGDVNGCSNRRAIAPIGGQQRGLLASEA